MQCIVLGRNTISRRAVNHQLLIKVSPIIKSFRRPTNHSNDFTEQNTQSPSSQSPIAMLRFLILTSIVTATMLDPCWFPALTRHYGHDKCHNVGEHYRNHAQEKTIKNEIKMSYFEFQIFVNSPKDTAKSVRGEVQRLDKFT